MAEARYLGLTANKLAKIASDLDSENASLRGAAQGLGRLCDDYKAENAKLREQGARLFDKTLELATENAKLRELMRDTYDCICEMYRYMDGRYACEDAEDDDAYGPILRRMRELGIEV